MSREEHKTACASHLRTATDAASSKAYKLKVDACVVDVFRKLAAPACVFVRVRALACARRAVESSVC